MKTRHLRLDRNPQLDAARPRAAVELVAVALERRRIGNLVVRSGSALLQTAFQVLPTPEMWPGCANTAYVCDGTRNRSTVKRRPRR